MPRRFIDRGTPLAGVQNALRDHRAPPESFRSLQNWRLPDGRLVRRRGFGEWSTTRVHGQQLVRGTPLQLRDIRAEDSGGKKVSSYYDSPLSYGLIRHDARFQPKIASAWSIEFLVTLGDIEELCVNGFTRQSLSDTTGNPATGVPRFYPRGGYNGASPAPQVGVYIFDQLLTANDCTFSDDDGATVTMLPWARPFVAGDCAYDNVALPALAVTYAKSGANVAFQLAYTTFLQVGGEYHRYLLTNLRGAYAVGDTYHIAITYDGVGNLIFRATKLGTAIDSGIVEVVDTTDKVWAGEDDGVNGVTAAIPRDIVLLNEGTVRGHYSSSCAPRTINDGALSEGAINLLMHSDVGLTGGVVVQQPNPWALSPPRGTAMSELRFWSNARSSPQLQAGMLNPVDPASSGLGAYFRLDDGGGYLVDKVSGWPLTIHHCNPQWVVDEDLLENRGIHFADGQHLILEMGPDDWRYRSDLAASVREVFVPVNVIREGGVNNLDGRSDCTVQLQIRTPKVFQANLMRTVGDNVRSGGFWDGTWTGSSSFFAGMGRMPSRVTGATTPQAARSDAFYATLFSIEGRVGSVKRDAALATLSTTYKQDVARVPLFQGLLDSSGRVVIRHFGMRHFAAGGLDNDYAPHMVEIRTNTSLSVDTVYTLTFVKKTVLDPATGAQVTNLKIYVNGSEPATTVNLGTYPLVDSSFCEHNYAMESSQVSAAGFVALRANNSSAYDICIGASRVNCAVAESIHVLDVASLTSWTNTEPGLSITANQRFMDPYADQPGFFTLGFFRLWGYGLSEDEVIQTYNRSIRGDSSFDRRLFINLELKGITGSTVQDVGPFRALFQMGFKSYGAGYWDVQSDVGGAAAGGARYASLAECYSFWSSEDCLQYRSQPALFDNTPTVAGVTKSEAICRGLIPFNDVHHDSNGLLAVMDDALRVDEAFLGSFLDLLSPGVGLLSDLEPGKTWQGVTAEDYTAFASAGGTPKAYDGTRMTRLGSTRWRGGSVYITAGSGGQLSSYKWYGVYLVYVSETTGVQYVSGPHVLNIGANNALYLYTFGAHFDPRVTNVYVYRTVATDSRALAESSPAFPVFDGPYIALRPRTGDANASIYPIFLGDGTLVNSALDRNVTPPPDCSLIAALGPRIFLAGDRLHPNTVYWSFPGRGQLFDIIDNRLDLGDTDGDRIVAMTAEFGSIFVFRAHSIWRLDDVGGEIRGVRILEGVGAISATSIASLVLPDNGRRVLLFWSQHGPYLFDGSNFTHIGHALENTMTGRGYEWLDINSIFLLHDSHEKEVICFYKSAGNSDTANATGIIDRAVVFNYRRGLWYSYTELIGSVASALFSISERSGSVTSAAMPLIGGANGLIYRWGLERTGAIAPADGRPTDGSPLWDVMVTGVAMPVITATGAGWIPKSLRGLWVTIMRHPAGQPTPTQWYSLPIIDNTSDTIRVNPAYYGSLPFVPTEQDMIYIGLPPAYAEQPWDHVDAHYVDKELERGSFWHTGTLYYKFGLDWNPASTDWAALAPPAQPNQRNLVTINKHFEAFKLYLMSTSTLARLDGLLYEVRFTMDPDRVQA